MDLTTASASGSVCWRTPSSSPSTSAEPSPRSTLFRSQSVDLGDGSALVDGLDDGVRQQTDLLADAVVKSIYERGAVAQVNALRSEERRPGRRLRARRWT